MGRIRAAFAVAAMGLVLLVAQSAPAETTAPAGPAASLAPATSTVPTTPTAPGGTVGPGPVEPGATIAAPPPPRKPKPKPSSGGGAVSAPEHDAGAQQHTSSRPQESGGTGASDTGTNPFPLSVPTPSYGLPGASSGSCTTTSPASRPAADLPAGRRDLLARARRGRACWLRSTR